MAREFDNNSASIFTRIPDNIVREWFPQSDGKSVPLVTNVALRMTFHPVDDPDNLTSLTSDTAIGDHLEVWKSVMALYEDLSTAIEDQLVRYRANRPDENLTDTQTLTSRTGYNIPGASVSIGNSPDKTDDRTIVSSKSRHHRRR
jgi:hypothetical protein